MLYFVLKKICSFQQNTQEFRGPFLSSFDLLRDTNKHSHALTSSWEVKILGETSGDLQQCWGIILTETFTSVSLETFTTVVTLNRPSPLFTGDLHQWWAETLYCYDFWFAILRNAFRVRIEFVYFLPPPILFSKILKSEI